VILEIDIKGRILIIIAIIVFFSAFKVAAQPEDKPNDVFANKIDSYFRYMPSRSVDAMEGKVEIVEADSEYSYELKLFGKLPVKFSLDNKYIGIEDSVTNVELPAHLVGLTTDIETTLSFFNFDQTYLRIGLSPSFYGDDWDFETSAFRLLSRFLILYIPNAKWTFLAGVAVYPDFENEALPVLGFVYKPNDKLAFNIIPPRPNITYLLNDQVTLFGEGGGSLNSEFEVTRNDKKNVVLRYKEMHLGAGIKLKLNKFIQSSLSFGSVFNRSLKYRDNQGKVEIKNGLYGEFRTEIAF
jgi:hypothetical protein